jgi:hypothetical protein
VFGDKSPNTLRYYYPSIAKPLLRERTFTELAGIRAVGAPAIGVTCHCEAISRSNPEKLTFRHFRENGNPEK